MQRDGVSDPTMSAVRKAITKEELAKHCRRRTRGADETAKSIEDLLLAFSTATDSLGIPVFAEKMVTIWEEEKQHVRCLQDPSGVTLYTTVQYITKDGVQLPMYRCARGTTSLESFHLHLARCIYLCVQKWE